MSLDSRSENQKVISTELARPTVKSTLVSYLVKYMNKVLKMANDLIEIVKFSGQPVSIHFFRTKE